MQQTDLSEPPYFDDYSEEKDFTRVLMKPAVPVQARELNEFQTLSQVQVQRFADGIYKSGTIARGCAFNFYPVFKFAKLTDLDADGVAIDVGLFENYFAICRSSGLEATVIDSAVGFESTPPDLNTIYLNYTNSGNTGDLESFSPGDILTITDKLGSVFSVSTDDPGVGFANTDSIVFSPAVAVNVSTGAFVNGQYVILTNGANLQIVGIDTTVRASLNQIVLNLRPRTADLANSAVNSSAWSVVGGGLHNVGNTAAGNVEAVLGDGARAELVTDSAGRLRTVTVEDRGAGYDPVPVVTVRSPNNAGGVAAANLNARNWLTTVTVANTVGSTGNGYAIGVGPGIVYQNGYFLRFAGGRAIVEKYSSSPNSVAVGFRTYESVITSDEDTSLLDNAIGSPNETAPGADRLKMVPNLEVFSVSNGQPTDTNLLPLVVWSEGNPVVQNQASAYSELGKALASRTSDSEGDFVISRFAVTSRSPQAANSEGNTYSVMVSPGTAYVNGFKVSTLSNFNLDIAKSLDSQLANSQTVTLGYGNWVRINEVGGLFQFSTGDVVQLRDTAKQFLSNTSLSSSGNTAAVGGLIGTARIRSLVHEDGVPGVPGTTYRLYLFDINLSTGQNFRNARSINYSGGGTADVVVELDPTTAANVAVLQDQSTRGLLFSAGVESLKNANNVQYAYRTIDQTLQFANTGILTKSLGSSPGEYFVQAGAWTDAEALDLFVIPTGGDLKASANVTGTVNTTSTSPTVTGVSTAFITDLRAGDWAQVYSNSTVSAIKKVISVSNNSVVTFDSNVGFTVNGAAVYRYFPKHVPIPFGARSGLTANADVTAKNMSLDLHMALTGATSVNAAVAVSILRNNVSQGTKSASRQQYVKIRVANNAGGLNGPWSVGVSDAIRFRGAWKFTNSSVNTSSSPVSSEFYIDHNQNIDYLGIGYLFKRPGSSLQLTSSDWLLVEFDMMTGTGGFYDTVSYLGSTPASVSNADSTPLANLGSQVASAEIPEVYDSRGNVYDLIRYFDFRPAAANTATPGSTPGAAPVNPAETVSFGNTADPANDKKFPLPGSGLVANIEQWLGRIDSVFVGVDSNIFVLSGKASAAGVSRKRANQPSNSLKVNDLSVPAFPSYPQKWSNTFAEIVQTNMANERFSTRRVQSRTIAPIDTPFEMQTQQPRRYTHADVGKLDRRLRNVEYVTGLTALETDMTKRIVPSSVDPSQNRFKFGFFADNFSSQVSQDRLNPQYAARIINQDLTPPVVSWAVNYGDGNPVSPPYTEFPIVDQSSACYHAASGNNVPIANTPLPNTPDPNPYTGTLTIFPDTVKTLMADWDDMTNSIPTGVEGRNSNDWETAHAGGQYGYIGAVSDLYTITFSENDNNGRNDVNSDYKQWGVDGHFIGLDTAFTVTVRGLKPNTVHNFKVGAIDHGSKCQQNGKLLGQPLVSDASGNLSFTWYFQIAVDRDVDAAIFNALAFLFGPLATGSSPTHDSRLDQSYPAFNVTLTADRSSAQGQVRAKSQWMNASLPGTFYQQILAVTQS